MMNATATIPPKPVVLPVEPDNIPDELRAVDRWVEWNWNWNGKKWTKPPYSVESGWKCDKTAPKNWAPFDDAISAHLAGRFDGVGFCFCPEDNLCGIDIDNCHDRVTGELATLARQIIEWADSYTEISPSGTGVKIYIRGSLPFNKNDHQRGVEVYRDGAYFCVTGRHLEGTPETVNVVSAGQVEVILALAFGDDDKKNASHSSPADDREIAVSALQSLPASMADGYGDWLRVGMALHSVDSGLLSQWDNWSRHSPKYVEGEPAKEWSSFNAAWSGGSRGPVGLGFLIYSAKQNGWAPPRRLNGSSRVISSNGDTASGPQVLVRNGLDVEPLDFVFSRLKITPDVGALINGGKPDPHTMSHELYRAIRKHNPELLGLRHTQ